MKIGLSYDLKEDISAGSDMAIDALEEYDSTVTVNIIRQTLEADGHTVIMLGGGREFLSKIMDIPVDIVFNIAEGRGNYRSRESQVPAVLEMLNIPYTGSDPQTLAVCLDKPLTKQLVMAAGIPTPDWRVISDMKDIKDENWEGFPFPAIVKPVYEGSSKGIHVTALVNSLKEAISEIQSQLQVYRQPVIIEEFINGDEITAGIIGNDHPGLVGIMQVVPVKETPNFVYSLEVKRDWENLVKYQCPAMLADKTMELIQEYSLKTFTLLGCRDFSRIDFRVSRNGLPYFIEINPLPGLGTYSDLIIMAEKQGGFHEDVISSVFAAGLERYPQLVCR